MMIICNFSTLCQNLCLFWKSERYICKFIKTEWQLGSAKRGCEMLCRWLWTGRLEHTLHLVHTLDPQLNDGGCDPQPWTAWTLSVWAHTEQEEPELMGRFTWQATQLKKVLMQELNFRLCQKVRATWKPTSLPVVFLLPPSHWYQ